ncbi:MULTISPECIES: histidine phosphatase family protein [Aliiglaciecola]|uniref:histidine phosphatase family protein n=1 Tax=Aliiglaciecola TaxID=1406885 RepID=UPI001C08EF2B|nr:MULTISPECIES: histidine phosphatase family protein [Aliiglaciecola]MBU2879633.1 phosphoglycerate mutase family protein [Aliiglaciecola lipolytica]MDO6710088.1 histidine phosphatase family protein [Aliiglaciecola sp. 2_MG-2023]MDO6751236.1 histidine phosphatase family protein [Aliiglaciecola sp. 1_MG-2023]
MTAIYLIRHGQASFGQQNYDKLSDVGHQQAKLLGNSLQTRIGDFDKVFLGSMLRHKQTLQNCLSGMSSVVDESNWNFDANWNEYDHNDIIAQMGPEFTDAPSVKNWLLTQNNPKAAFEKLFNDAMNRWMSGQHCEEYVESWERYLNRIKGALENVINNAKGAKKVAVFTSGGPISVVSQYLLGIPPSNVMQVNWTLVNCGITKLVNTQSRVFLSTLNDHSHFEGQHKSLITYK